MTIMMMMIMSWVKPTTAKVKSKLKCITNKPPVLRVLVPCEQKQAPESNFGEVRIADRVRETVPSGRTSNGKSPGAAVSV